MNTSKWYRLYRINDYICDIIVIIISLISLIAFSTCEQISMTMGYADVMLKSVIPFYRNSIMYLYIENIIRKSKTQIIYLYSNIYYIASIVNTGRTTIGSWSIS